MRVINKSVTQGNRVTCRAFEIEIIINETTYKITADEDTEELYVTSPNNIMFYKLTEDTIRISNYDEVD